VPNKNSGGSLRPGGLKRQGGGLPGQTKQGEICVPVFGGIDAPGSIKDRVTGEAQQNERFVVFNLEPQ